MLETKNLFELTFIPVSCYSPEVLKKKTHRTGDAWNIAAGGLNSLKIVNWFIQNSCQCH